VAAATPAATDNAMNSRRERGATASFGFAESCLFSVMTILVSWLLIQTSISTLALCKTMRNLRNQLDGD
jgi:hypothetical protein